MRTLNRYEKPASLGVDIGSVSTKGVVIDERGVILAREYIKTQGSPVRAARRLLRSLESQMPVNTAINAVGVTGSARKLVGLMLGAGVVKNEITAHAVGTLSRRPDVRTILEIGGQDSKIIILDGGIVTDYAMNTLCAAGTGAFLAAQAKRLGVSVEDMGKLALQSKNPVKIAARCAVFAESDMVHKAQAGHRREDLIAGLCYAVAANFLGDVGKGKNIRAPVVFQGGVSKNPGVVRAFRDATGLDIHVDDDSHLLGAVGAAVLARSAPLERPFDFAVADVEFDTGGHECAACPNRCDIMLVYRGGELLDTWGSRCADNRVQITDNR